MPRRPPRGCFSASWESDAGSLLHPAQSGDRALYLQNLLSRELKELRHRVASAVKPVLWKKKSS